MYAHTRSNAHTHTYTYLHIYISNIVITHVLYYDTTLFKVKLKNTVKACISVNVSVSTAYLYVYYVLTVVIEYVYERVRAGG